MVPGERIEVVHNDHVLLRGTFHSNMDLVLGRVCVDGFSGDAGPIGFIPLVSMRRI